VGGRGGTVAIASGTSLTVRIVIPSFYEKVETQDGVARRLGYNGRTMDKTALTITLFFIFMLGAGVGFYLMRLIF